MIEKTKTKLISKLEIAINIAFHFPGYNGEDFHSKLQYGLGRLNENNFQILNSLILWFTPTFDWDEFRGDSDLREEIYELLIDFQKQLNSEKTGNPAKKNMDSGLGVELKGLTKKEIFAEIQLIIEEGKLNVAFKLAKIHKISEKELTKPWENLIKNTVVFVDIKTKIHNLHDLFAATDITYFNRDMKFISPKIGCLKNLRKLSLSNNKLTKLPKEIGNLTNLVSLDLGGNKLKTLPKEIANLTNLTYFNFSNNNFTKFPQEIINFTELEHLYLYENQISKLPEDFGKLTELRKLMLKNNKFSVLPSSFKNLININDLYLENNLFDSVPESLKYLKKLKSLRLGHNNIKKIPKFLEDLSRLNRLHVDRGVFTAEQEIRFKRPPQEYGF